MKDLGISRDVGFETFCMAFSLKLMDFIPFLMGAKSTQMKRTSSFFVKDRDAATLWKVLKLINFHYSTTTDDTADATPAEVLTVVKIGEASPIL